MRYTWPLLLLGPAASLGALVACGEIIKGTNNPADPSTPDAPDGSEVVPSSLSDGGTSTFCSTVDAAFCADFDGVDAGFSGSTSSNAVTSLASSDRSAPFAWQVDVFSPDASPGAAQLWKRLPRPDAGVVSVDVDVRIDTRAATDAGTPYTAILGVILDGSEPPAAPTTFYAVAVDGPTFSVHTYDPSIAPEGYVATDSTVPIPSGWFHLRFEASFVAKTATLSIDSVKALVITGTRGISSTEPSFYVGIGAYVVAARPTTRVVYDNIRISFGP
jgi:hypothetical protein